MPAMIGKVTTPEQAQATCPVVYTTLYDLIAAVQDAVAPGEEASVTPIVVHLLHAGHARFLRDVDVDMLWANRVPAGLFAAESCCPV